MRRKSTEEKKRWEMADFWIPWLKNLPKRENLIRILHPFCSSFGSFLICNGTKSCKSPWSRTEACGDGGWNEIGGGLWLAATDDELIVRNGGGGAIYMKGWEVLCWNKSPVAVVSWSTVRLLLVDSGKTLRLPRGIIGLWWVCWPSYVVTTIVWSPDDRSTLFFTPHPAVVQR